MSEGKKKAVRKIRTQEELIKDYEEKLAKLKSRDKERAAKQRVVLADATDKLINRRDALDDRIAANEQKIAELDTIAGGASE